ncbi:unannotated protein [freshwater metagenome]|uniref:Unannotated protein n=1 Tax=freshwater metagenome TaxID=449393 RepID=A0A6J6C7H0_9ZZZZ
MLSIFKELFADCEPASWHGLIPDLSWEAIWSFNIDDSIETAYQNNKSRRQVPRTLIWTDQTTPYGGDAEEFPLVHLHGYVGSLGRNPSPNLIFDQSEYMAALRTSTEHNWHTILRADYARRPFIVLGARLHDETDLIEVLHKGNRSHDFGFPSLIVLPGVDEFTRREYERFGLVVVNSPAGEFFDYLHRAVHATETQTTSSYTSIYLGRVLAPLIPNTPAGSPRGHDFYNGHEPIWADIVADLDGIPTWVNRLSEDIGAPNNRTTQATLYLIHGPAFTGKTTSLLRLAHELTTSGWRPYVLEGYERINPEEFLRFFADRPDAVLLIDNAASEVGEVAQLLKLARNSKVPLLIIGAERDAHVDHIRRALPSWSVIGLESTVFVTPTPQLWREIVEVRGRHARLGRLEGLDRRSQELHFVTNGRDLFSSLATLEDAHGFIDRGAAAYQSAEPKVKGIFTAVALVAKYGLSVPINIVSEVTGQDVNEIFAELDPGGPLSDWIVTDKNEVGAIRLRHHFLADLITSDRCSAFHMTPLSELGLRIAKSCAPFINPRAMRRRTHEFRIVREMMRVEAVRDLLGRDDVDDWYAELEEYYNKNARYWEQRALALTSDLGRAFSYAKKAVACHEDAFTLNTLGTVLMRRAGELSEQIQPTTRFHYWVEGLDALAKSARISEGEFEHPYMTFFTYTHRLMPILPSLDSASRARVQAAYAEWRQEAIRLGHFEFRHVRQAADVFPDAWRMSSDAP